LKIAPTFFWVLLCLCLKTGKNLVWNFWWDWVFTASRQDLQTGIIQQLY
jgi:hypothetical protein